MPDFKSVPEAGAALAGIELIHLLRKGGYRQGSLAQQFEALAE